MRLSIHELARKLSRETSSGGFVAEIDGLRFVAILSVVLFHLNWLISSKTGRGQTSDPFAEFLSHGYIGVELFFVLSGFVIALPFARARLLGTSRPSLRDYFLRRLTRLEPPYLISLLVRFLMLVLVTGARADELLPHLLASMAYLHNIIYGCESSINFVAWSLEVELQFYLVAPLFASLFAIRPQGARRIVMAALIVAFSAAGYLVHGSPRYTLSLLSAGQFFLAGFLLADCYLEEWRHDTEKSYRWDAVSLLAWGAVALLLYGGREGEALVVVAIFFAYVGAFRGKLSNRFFCQPPVYLIGGMCYTIYLYHYSVISALIRPLLHFPFWSRIPLWLAVTGASCVVLPVVLAVSAVLFLAIEKPCMAKEWHLKLATHCKAALKSGGGVTTEP